MVKWLKPAGTYVRGLKSLKQIGTICFAFLFSIFSTNLFATDPNIPANATSASCDNSTLNTYSGTSNLQANWEANQIGLYWYCDDEQITTVQDAATTCNYDGTLSVPSTPPTKTGYTFNGWKVRGLPEGYTRLQYLESTGTQLINTGVGYNASKTITLMLTIQSDYYSTSNHLALGFGGSTGQWFGVNSGKWTIGSGGVSTVVASNKTSNIEIKWTGGKEYLKIGANSIGSRSTTSNSNTLQLFGRAGSGVFSGKIYFAQIFVDGVLVKDLIPAKNSSNVLGMYDTVSKTFFTNVGSGTFTAGPAVQ